VASIGPVVAVAGIARPARFFDDLTSQGVTVAARETFPDHHRYTQRDVDRAIARARAAGAAAIATTEKDAVRLDGFDWQGIPVWWFPLEARIAPADDFLSWLGERLTSRR
jgi:tetraacyldisaccharide 4'-kinase